jgi:uncharacterized protein (DUF3084 family)
VGDVECRLCDKDQELLTVYRRCTERD